MIETNHAHRHILDDKCRKNVVHIVEIFVVVRCFDKFGGFFARSLEIVVSSQIILSCRRL